MEPVKKPKESEDQDPFVVTKRNEHMETFYNTQFPMEELEAQAFWESLKAPLPVTIRVNPLVPSHSLTLAQLSDPSFTAELESSSTLQPVTWFPNNLVWQLNTSRGALKRTEGAKRLHSWIHKAFESGVIARQELVSMVPPLLLAVSPGSSVFDMCAAPGSKTTQMIEMLEHSGLIVANDADPKRAFMLIHQMQRCSTPSMLITNHQAQNYPSIGSKWDRFLFDKILCDVPCTGDGAIRKLPLRWKNWNVKDGCAMHTLQLNILRKAIRTCKVGGTVCYSTCSLNPIEDEAVVNQALRDFKGEVQLVDVPGLIDSAYPGLKYHRGLRHWKVLGNRPRDESSLFIEYPEFSAVPEGLKSIKPSMFPVEVPAALEQTIRIMPHDNDSGGFYIALFCKTSAEEIKQPAEEEKLSKKQRNLKQSEFRPISLELPEVATMVEYYGLSLDILPFCYSAAASDQHRNIFLISPQLKEFLSQDTENKLKILNLGTKVFTKHKFKHQRDCMFRPSQEGLEFLLPHISKRKASTSDFSFFGRIVKETIVETSDISDSEFVAATEGVGYFLVEFVLSAVSTESLVTLKIQPQRFTVMAPKEHLESLKIKYKLS